MIKSRCLDDVAPNEAFYTKDGTYQRNLYELLHTIEEMDDSSFSYYVSKDHDDFVFWIENSVNCKSLSSDLRGVLSRKKYINIFKRKLSVLEARENLLHSTLSIKNEFVKQRHWFLLIAFFLMTLINFGLFMYISDAHQWDVSKMNEIDNRMANFVEKQVTADNVLFKHLMNIEINFNKSANQSILNIDNPFVFMNVKSPHVRLSEKNIQVTNKSASVLLQKPRWGIVGDTKSMEPVLTVGTQTIDIKPKSQSNLHVGDIITYEDESGELIIHRISEIGNDTNGWYAVTKGDNNPYKDLQKVRFSQVSGVVVGIFY